jgi:hypothetical protein
MPYERGYRAVAGDRMINEIEWSIAFRAPDDRRPPRLIAQLVHDDAHPMPATAPHAQLS